MSPIIENVDIVKKNLNKLADRLTYSNITDEELKEIFVMLDDCVKVKEVIEQTVIDKDSGKQIGRCFNVSRQTIRDLRTITHINSSTVQIKGFPQHDPKIDTYVNELEICAEFGIKTPTLQRWRRNWRNEKSDDVKFPPPVLYVFRQPKWTLRQLEWWLEHNKGKIFIKGVKYE